jgi:hypothetical protein
VTGIESANRVLSLCGQKVFDLQSYPPPEPLAGWIEALIMRGRRKRRMNKMGG